MNITFIIIIGMLILSILAPFISLYAISLIKKKQYKKHVKIQKRLFWVCIMAVVVLELQIRFSGGSGSLIADSEYAGTTFFKAILIAHIIGAVLTYLIWGISVYMSSKKWKAGTLLSGGFSAAHKTLGYITVVGLFYTAITAFVVATYAFFL